MFSSIVLIVRAGFYVRQVVAFLVAHGARVDAVDRWGGSPLHDAMKNGHKEVVQYVSLRLRDKSRAFST